MADISAWSPVDESNTAAPPNGWPEFMQNSMVNNSARAMMGAIRRFYDQVIAGTLELPYLKLSGGTVTGSLSAVDYKLSGVIFAGRDASLNAHYLVDADGYDASILLGGAASGYINYYRAETHLFQSNNATLTYGGFNPDGLFVNSTITAGGNVNVTNTLAAAAVLGTTVHANTTLSAGTSVAAPTIAASGALSGGNITSANNITASTGTVTAAQLTSTGNVSATGTVTAASLHSTGDLFVTGLGQINGNLAVAGTVFAHAYVDTDGVLLLDVIAALEARIAALEAA